MQPPLDVAPNVTHTENLAEFRRAVTASFVPLQVQPEHNGHFAAIISSAGADGVVFTEVDADPQQVHRTPESIEQGGSGYYKVGLLLSGSGILIQDGRELVMRPGDLSFYDTSRPYSLLFEEKFRNLIMMFPKDRLDVPESFADTLTAVSLGQEHQLAHAIAPFIAQASPQLAVLPQPARAKLARASLELMNAMLSAILDTPNEIHHPHQRLLQKIYSYISANLGSPELSPGSIAAAHYISIRHLHALFAEQGTTVSTVIRQRRLERAKTDLSDPLQSDRTVSGIAARWGFADAAHFSRVFKQCYGASPGAFRARQHERPDQSVEPQPRIAEPRSRLR